MKDKHGRCRFCGNESTGEAFSTWVKPTFTDFDKLQTGEIVCHDCLFFFNEASTELAARMGKDKPQKMRNYSHFIVKGEWVPLSKGNKAEMRALLLGDTFPELAAIADSGQKHIVFRATRNPIGSKAGWVQFEEQRIYLVPDDLRKLLDPIEALYETFSKGEIESGEYAGYRILKFGLERWQQFEGQIKPWRGNPIFALALFLAQKKDGNGESSIKGPSRRIADGDLARHADRLQEPLSSDDLGAVRESGEKCGIHEQSGEVYKPTLFET